MGEMKVQRNLLETGDKFIENKVVSLKVDVKPLIDDFKTTLQSFEEDIEILKKVMLQGSPSGSEALSKIHVLELKGFNDNLNAKELENFVWDMEQYFKVVYL